MSFSSHFRNLVFGCFWATKLPKYYIICSLFTFFTKQGKTGKNGTHGNENLATYFEYFGRRKKNLRKYVMSWAILTEISSQAAAKSKPQVLGS